MSTSGEGAVSMNESSSSSSSQHVSDGFDVEAQETDPSFVPSLAKVLTHLISMSQPNTGQVTRFHAIKAPSISIHEYLTRIAKYFGCSCECFVLSLVYIDRIVKLHQDFCVNALNIHRLLVTSITLAVKFFDDQFYSNAYYAKVGGVKTREINVLEAHFLALINYHLFVTPQEYDQYRNNVLMAVNATSVPRAISDSATAEGAEGEGDAESIRGDDASHDRHEHDHEEAHEKDIADQDGGEGEGEGQGEGQAVAPSAHPHPHTQPSHSSSGGDNNTYYNSAEAAVAMDTDIPHHPSHSHSHAPPHHHVPASRSQVPNYPSHAHQNGTSYPSHPSSVETSASSVYGQQGSCQGPRAAMSVSACEASCRPQVAPSDPLCRRRSVPHGHSAPAAQEPSSHMSMNGPMPAAGQTQAAVVQMHVC
ncbi:unnamed protein product [Vitrella brassicaformis CCMP3155]|uniref:Cyclin n=2 Tax=Vitrella brassicaformis TaxID=1169539 RepID=A0A0G4FLT3_VITBC|nr:unnamed protein product [Vitrella brassicaformis CCMP3155]|eukprot:CEM14973.1 unnamed protein product [Vitrella brassicaformis CCMP3155]